MSVEQLPPLKQGMYRWYPSDWSVDRISSDSIPDVVKCNCLFDARAKGMVNTMIKNAPKGG